MIDTGPHGRVFVHRAPVDQRKHFNTLWGVVSAMGHRVLDGDTFVFIGRTRKRVKVLWWDGTGLCVLSKRLDKGCYIAPWLRREEGALELSRAELALLLEGCEVVGRIKLSPEPWLPGTA